MIILIIGLGFVGLTTALGFADKGHIVYGVDNDSHKIDELSKSSINLYEPGLNDALKRNLNKSFNLISVLPENICNIDVVFICVGTPCREDGSVDLSCIFSAIDGLNKNFKGLLIIKSTVPPATTKEKIIPYIKHKKLNCSVAVNPEFLREGYSWEDFMNPDRIVCGIEDDTVAEILKSIYRDFNAPVIITTLNTAEYIKYLSNTMLANMISFSNEMSIIANAIGNIFVKQAFEALHADKRWGGAPMKNYVYPGCGFGGYCLPKDLSAMITQAKDYGVEPALLKAIQSINRTMPSFYVSQLMKEKPKNIGILGLSFKPHTNDVRHSPAVPIIKEIINKGCREIYAYDPVSNGAFKQAYPFEIHYCNGADEVCKKTKNVIIITAWEEFKGIDKLFPEVKFIDGRHIL